MSESTDHHQPILRELSSDNRVWVLHFPGNQWVSVFQGHCMLKIDADIITIIEQLEGILLKKGLVTSTSPSSVSKETFYCPLFKLKWQVTIRHCGNLTKFCHLDCLFAWRRIPIVCTPTNKRKEWTVINICIPISLRDFCFQIRLKNRNYRNHITLPGHTLSNKKSKKGG